MYKLYLYLTIFYICSDWHRQVWCLVRFTEYGTMIKLGMHLHVHACTTIGSKSVCVRVLSSTLWVAVHVCMNNHIHLYLSKTTYLHSKICVKIWVNILTIIQNQQTNSEEKNSNTELIRIVFLHWVAFRLHWLVVIMHLNAVLLLSFYH